MHESQLLLESEVSDRDAYGRDKDGQYLDQTEYVMHRNQLNQEEHNTQDVYNDLRDKLRDADYLQQSVENTAELMNGTASSNVTIVSSGNFTSNSSSAMSMNITQTVNSLRSQVTMLTSNRTIRWERILTDEDEQDAADQIPMTQEDDTETLADGEENPANAAGALQALWPDEEIPTDYQASCYLERYPDVVQKIGGNDLTAAKMQWMTDGREEGRVMTCNLGENAGMTDAQATCYRARYPTLSGKSLAQIKTGWYRWGRRFGRNKYCAPRITLMQSYCMLARYDDLMAQYSDVLTNAVSGKQDYRMQKYWEVKGFFEDRDYSCANLGSSLVPCAQQGGVCGCPHGQVYFVQRKRNGVTMTPQESLQFRYTVFDTNDKSVSDPTAPVLCERDTFLATAGNAVGPAGPDTGCLCQTAPTKFPPPLKCADEGETCQCQGTVFFGKEMPATNDTTLSLFDAFEDFVTEPYAVKHHANGDVACMADQFSAEYEFGSNSSSCFCDSSNYYGADAVERDINYFTAEYRQYQLEQQQAAIEAQKAQLQAAAAAAAASAQQAAQEIAAEKAKLEQEAIARQQAAWATKDAEDAAARQQQAQAEMAAQDLAQAQEKAATEALHQAELAEAEAAKMADAAEHQEDMGRIQAKIDAAMALDAAQAAEDAARLAIRQAEEQAEHAAHQAEAAAHAAEAQALADQTAAYDRASEALIAEEAALAEANYRAQQDAAAAEAAAAENARAQQAIDAAVAAAVAEFEAQEEARVAAWMAEEEAKAQAREAEKARLEQEAADRAAAQEAARLAAEQAEADAKAALAAAQALARQQEVAQRDEANRLAAELREQQAQEAADQQALLEAQKAEEAATSAAEKAAAQAAAAEAQAKLDAADAAVAEAEAHQRMLAERVAAVNLQIAAAEREEQEALAAKQAAEDAEAADHARKAAAEARMQAEFDLIDEAKRAHEEELERQKQANIAYLEQLRVKQEQEQAAAHAAAEAAHQQAIAARQAQEDRQKALHARLMAERKANLEDQYAHLWIDGDTNVVICEVLVPDIQQVYAATEELFFNNWVADVFYMRAGAWHGSSINGDVETNIDRYFVESHKMEDWPGSHRVYYVTTTWHVPNLMGVLEKKLAGTSGHTGENINLLIRNVATGNKNYINWVLQNTVEVGSADIAAIMDELALGM